MQLTSTSASRSHLHPSIFSSFLSGPQDENTRYIDIGPVNKTLNMLSCWFEDPDSEAFRRHIPRCGAVRCGAARRGAEHVHSLGRR